MESLIFAHSGQELLIHKRDGQLDFLDPQTAEPVRPALIPGGKLVHVSYSSDDRQVLTISDQGQVAFWTLGDTATALANHRLVSGDLQDCRLSPDRDRLLTLGTDGLVRLHSVAGASPLGLVLPSDDPGTQVAFHPDGRRFLTGDAAGVVRLWDPASCQSGHRDLPHDGEISDMAVTGDGNCPRATASEDGKCQLWSTDDGLPVGVPPPPLNPVCFELSSIEMAVCWRPPVPIKRPKSGMDGQRPYWQVTLMSPRSCESLFTLKGTKSPRVPWTDELPSGITAGPTR